MAVLDVGGVAVVGVAWGEGLIRFLQFPIGLVTERGNQKSIFWFVVGVAFFPTGQYVVVLEFFLLDSWDP